MIQVIQYWQKKWTNKPTSFYLFSFGLIYPINEQLSTCKLISICKWDQPKYGKWNIKQIFQCKIAYSPKKEGKNILTLKHSQK